MATVYRCSRCGLEVSADSSSEIAHLRSGIQCPGTGDSPYTMHTFMAIGQDTRAGRANIRDRDTWRAEQARKKSERSFSSGLAMPLYKKSGGGGFVGKLLLGIFAIGLIGFANGGPEFFDSVINIFNPVNKGNDPMDYYGTYYFNEANTNVVKVELLQDDRARITDDYGINTPITLTYTYEFVSSEYAFSKLQNETYQEYDSIFVYITEDKNQVIALWIVDNTPNDYRFLYGTSGRTVGEGSKTLLTFSSIMNDPKDYYGTYRNGNSSLVVKSSGTADLVQSTTETYLYRYVSEEFLRRYFSQSNYEEALVLFKQNSNSYLIFGIINSNTLQIQSGFDTFTFQK